MKVKGWRTALVGLGLPMFGAMFGSVGCVSNPVRPLGMEHELPKDLPDTLREKFEVIETASAPAPISDGPFLSESTPPSPRHPKKKQKKASETPAEVMTAPIPVNDSVPDPKKAIWIGERLTYTISYMGLPAGSLTLEVQPFNEMDHRKVYHILGHVVNSGLLGIFYRMDDLAETFVDYEAKFSHRFHLVVNDSRQTRDSLELYDTERSQTFYWNRYHPKDGPSKETKEYAPIKPFPQDSLSSLYYVRTVPLTIGSVVTFPLVMEGKQWEAICTVVRRELLDTPIGRVSTIVLKPEMRLPGNPQKKGNTYLWLTDDDRRIPVRLEAKVKIGTVSAHLQSAELGTPP